MDREFEFEGGPLDGEKTQVNARALYEDGTPASEFDTYSPAAFAKVYRRWDRPNDPPLRYRWGALIDQQL